MNDSIAAPKIAQTLTDSLPNVASDSLSYHSVSLHGLTDFSQNLQTDNFFAAGLPQDPSLALQTSLFQGHALPLKNVQPIERPSSFSLWFFGALFLGFILYAWILSFNYKRLRQLLWAPLSNNRFQRFRREGAFFNEPQFIPFLLLFILCMTLLAYRFHAALGLSPESEITAIGITAFLGLAVAILLVKVAIIKILAWIFKEQVAAQTYLLNLFVFDAVIALGLLPLLLIIYFSELWLQNTIVWTIAGLLAVLYFWRFIRCFALCGSQCKFSYLHIFLYFCTLELGTWCIAGVLIYLI